MNYLSRGMTLVRQWFPEVPGGLEGAHSREPLTVELNGTVAIARAGGDRIEASIAGRIRAQGPDGPLRSAGNKGGHYPLGLDSGVWRAETRVEARHCSSGALAEADPFVWLQLFDDDGIALTHETFLGRGVGIAYKVHAWIEVPTLVEPPIVAESDDRVRMLRRSASCTRLASGLHARVMTRTYRNPSGPRYHAEALVLELLSAGAELPVPAISVLPDALLVPERLGVPAWAGMAEAR
jgi:hypothetical protein